MSPTASLSISSGYATDSTASALIKSASTISWLAANGNAINGIAGGGNLSASATIHFYLCNGNNGTGAMASGIYPFATSLCPSGYNSFGRRIFSINTSSAGTPLSGTAIETWGGALRFYLANVATDLNNVTITNTPTLATMTVPQGIKVGWFGRLVQGSNVSNTLVSSPDETSVTPSNSGFTTNPGIDMPMNGGAAPFTNSFAKTTNALGQIRLTGSNGTGTTETVFTQGYDDWRRN